MWKWNCVIVGSLLQMVVSAGAQKWINNACSSTVTGQLKLITNGSLTVKPTAAVVIRERTLSDVLLQKDAYMQVMHA